MKARVLLVGPTDTHFEQLKLELLQAGFLIESAAGGTEALEIGFRFQPHLVVTELELEGIDGFELSLRISSGQARFTAKVIFYAQAYRDEKSRQTTVSKYGAVAYFVKPFHKHALLKAATDILTPIEFEGSETMTLPSLAEAIEEPASTRSEEISEPAAATILQNDTHLFELDELAETKLPQGWSEQPPSQAEEACKDNGGMTTVMEPIPPSIASERESEANSTPSEEVLVSQHATNKIQADLPPVEGFSEAPVPLSPEESKKGKPSRPELSRGAKIMVAAAVALLVVGLSLSLWLSRSHLPQVSRQVSNLSPRAQDSIPPVESKEPETSTPPASAAQSPAPGVAAGEAVVRPLGVSGSGKRSGDQSRATGARPERALKRGPAFVRELVISDVSRADQQPFLTDMSRPSLSEAEFRAMGSRSYVVSVELDQNGTVRDARLITSHAEGSFPTQILDTVRKWRFVPRDKAQRGAWVKYFTFQARSPTP